jgi:hypothetical protein
MPVFAINPLERVFYPLLDLFSLVARVFELAQMLHPRLFLSRYFELLHNHHHLTGLSSDWMTEGALKGRRDKPVKRSHIILLRSP